MTSESDEGELPRDPVARPFFVLFTLFAIGSVASRFDLVLARTPEWLEVGVLFAHGPLLFVAALLESRMVQSTVGPAWMRIRDPFVRAAFTFSLTYLCVIAIQVLDIELGPVDPTPPAEWPDVQRAGWFAMFTFGFAGITYMALVGAVVPILRFITRPLRWSSLWITIPIVALLGAGLASLLLWIFSWPAVQEGLAVVSEKLEDPPVLVAVLLVPVALEVLFARATR